MNFLAYNALAISHFQERQFELAIKSARHAVQVNPRFSVSRAFLTAALQRAGRTDEAREQARQVLALDPGFTVRRFAVTVEIEPQVFTPLAEAWLLAGLPDG